MTLADFATFSTAVSGLAVTASLIYLALQTHQNAKHTKALIHQGRADRNSNQVLMMAETELVSAWLMESGVPATPEEIRRRQFLLQCSALVSGWRDIFAQHEAGLLTPDLFADLTANVGAMLKVSPAVRHRFQQIVASCVPSKFKTYLAQLVAQSESPDKAAVD